MGAPGVRGVLVVYWLPLAGRSKYEVGSRFMVGRVVRSGPGVGVRGLKVTQLSDPCLATSRTGVAIVDIPRPAKPSRWLGVRGLG